MAKQKQIHTTMIGRTILLNEEFADPIMSRSGPWSRLRPFAGKVGEIVNVYMQEGCPTYDVAFGNELVEGVWNRAFKLWPYETTTTFMDAMLLDHLEDAVKISDKYPGAQAEEHGPRTNAVRLPNGEFLAREPND